MLTKPASKDHIPSLDGLRAISILLVILAHISQHFQATYHNNMLDALAKLGNLGVQVFFVISGFLITTLLLNELKKGGHVSKRAFYVKRFFRIFPLAYLYIAVMALLSALSLIDLGSRQIIGSLLYLYNFPYFRADGLLGHFWSLAVEEQFYILFPFIFFTGWIRKKYLIAFACIFLLVFLALLFASPEHTWKVVYGILSFSSPYMSIAVGCCIAYTGIPRIGEWWFLKKYKTILNIAGLCIALGITMFVSRTFITLLAIDIAIATILVTNVIQKTGIFFKLYNLPWMAKLGTYSFSMYIWQQPLTRFYFFPGWYGVVLNMLLLGVVTYASYTFFETPMRNLKRYFL